jgi:hypothetical protein
MSKMLEWPGFLLTILLVTLVAGCGSLGGPKIVGSAFTGDEIRKLIVGNTLQGPAGTQMYDWYYAGDGAVTGVIGASNDHSGTWLIKDGNVYCHRWDQYFDGVQHCYEFYKVERSGEYIMKNVDVDHGENIEIWKLIQGNPYNM